MTTVETPFGTLRGVLQDGLHVFRGVPFARPPVGRLRLRPPEPPEPWPGERDATRFGPSAPQPLEGIESSLFSDIRNTSEDCLYLNVWTPDTHGSRPVLVWLHGGSFVFGAGSQVWYDGATLSRRGELVVVTVNYRLGALGYLYLAGESGEPPTANLGLLDQVAALEWVRDCIESFGGDPGNVTLAGESAGALSIGTLLAVPRARGLFRRAIAQSGATQGCTDPETADRESCELLADIGVHERRPEALEGVPLEAIMSAQQAHMARVQAETTVGRRMLAFSPVVDGHTVPVHPLTAVKQGAAAGVALLIGTNRDETKVFSLGDPAASDLDEPALLERLVAVVPDRPAAEMVLGTYRDRRNGAASPADLWVALGSDYVFRMPAVRLAEAQLSHGEVWSYLFTWEARGLGGLLGSSHAVEVPFVWGSHLLPTARAMLGDGDDAHQLALGMQEAWSSFALDGRPRSPRLPPWPPYCAEKRQTMVLGASSYLASDPFGAERAAWQALI